MPLIDVMTPGGTSVSKMRFVFRIKEKHRKNRITGPVRQKGYNKCLKRCEFFVVDLLDCNCHHRVTFLSECPSVNTGVSRVFAVYVEG